MKLLNNVLIFDTETVGDFETPIIHDIGYQIIDKDFTVLCSRRMLVKETRTPFLLKTSFYLAHKAKYDRDLANDSVDVVSWLDVINQLNKDLFNYNVNLISAYNLGFDLRALEKTNEFYCNQADLSKIKKRQLLCIWELSCSTFMREKSYRNFCRTYNYISAKNNFLTNAEVAYKFINQMERFEEQHTALEDVIIERQILQYIVMSKKYPKKEYGVKYGCWKKVQVVD